MGAPKPPDPRETANAQLDYSRKAATSQAYMNQVNQNTPFGSLNYSQTGTAPDGTPTFTATQSFDPKIQSVIDGLIGRLDRPATDMSGEAITNQQMDLYRKYMDPIFAQQKGALDSTLWNKGIRPGSKQYETAQNLESRNTNDALINFLLQSRGQAMNELQAGAMQPYQELQALRGTLDPTFAQTPQQQIQTPDYQGAVQQNYAQKQANYNNMMTGAFGIPSSVLGGWARGGFRT